MILLYLLRDRGYIHLVDYVTIVWHLRDMNQSASEYTIDENVNTLVCISVALLYSCHLYRLKLIISIGQREGKKNKNVTASEKDERRWIVTELRHS